MQIACTECGESLVIPDKWEMDERDPDDEDVPETPVTHYQRTGHVPVQKPQATGCHRCGNIWFYKGERNKSTCPNCKSATGVGSVGFNPNEGKITVNGEAD